MKVVKDLEGKLYDSTILLRIYYDSMVLYHRKHCCINITAGIAAQAPYKQSSGCPQSATWTKGKHHVNHRVSTASPEQSTEMSVDKNQKHF